MNRLTDQPGNKQGHQTSTPGFLYSKDKRFRVVSSRSTAEVIAYQTFIDGFKKMRKAKIVKKNDKLAYDKGAYFIVLFSGNKTKPITRRIVYCQELVLTYSELPMETTGLC